MIGPRSHAISWIEYSHFPFDFLNYYFKRKYLIQYDLDAWNLLINSISITSRLATKLLYQHFYCFHVRFLRFLARFILFLLCSRLSGFVSEVRQTLNNWRLRSWVNERYKKSTTTKNFILIITTTTTITLS